MTVSKLPGRVGLLAALLGATPACAVVAMAYPKGRSGRLTTADGAPVANAEVVVDSWQVDPLDRRREGLPYTYRTKTDSDGRWVVPARPAIRMTAFGTDSVPGREDDYTFRAAGHTDLHVELPERPRADTTAPPTMRVDGSGPPPLGPVTLLVFGGALGAGQRYSAHAGGMFVVSRDGFGVGGRAAAELGRAGVGGDAGIVLVPLAGTTPNLAVELNARYLRSWSAGPASESGPEIGIDVIGYRFTLSWLGPEIDTSPDRRRLLIGFGFGYF